MEKFTSVLSLNKSPKFLSQLFNDKEFYGTLRKLALPIIIQFLVMNSLNFVDLIMVGKLGEIAVAGVGIANQFFFVFTCVLNGLCTAAGILTAQFWGKKDIPYIRFVLGCCLMLTSAVGLIFTMIAVVFPEQAMRMYTADSNLIEAGSSFIRIMGISFGATAITFCYSAVLRSMENVKLPMIISIFSLSINTILNYCLIGGHFGFPAMGIEGSATATCIARFLEAVLLVFIIFWSKSPVSMSYVRSFFQFDFTFMRNFMKTAIPLLAAIMLWAFGLTVYYIIFARIDTVAVAAVSIATTIEGLAFVIFIGLCGACNVMVGNRIGADEDHKAYDYALKMLFLGAFGAIIIGGIILMGKNPILSFYELSDTGAMYAANILNVMACFLWMKVLNMILIQGILNAGGDTKYTLIRCSLSMWLIGIPAAFIGGFLLHLPIYWVILFTMAEEIVKLVLLLPRLITRRWIHNLTKQFQG